MNIYSVNSKLQIQSENNTLYTIPLKEWSNITKTNTTKKSKFDLTFLAGQKITIFTIRENVSIEDLLNFKEQILIVFSMFYFAFVIILFVYNDLI